MHIFKPCFRVPGKDYHDFEVAGPDLPDTSCYRQVCGDCFRKKPQREPLAEASDASTGSSSSSDEGADNSDGNAE